MIKKPRPYGNAIKLTPEKTTPLKIVSEEGTE